MELIWVSGASQGIGKALIQTVPWPAARVIGVSRSPGPAPHLAADLADPAGWDMLEASFRRELAGFPGRRVVFRHAAGAIGPAGFAGETDPGEYRSSVLLNAAAPLVVADALLRAAGHLSCRRQLSCSHRGPPGGPTPEWPPTERPRPPLTSGCGPPVTSRAAAEGCRLSRSPPAG